MAATQASDIRATSPRDTFTGVAARSVPVTRTHPLPLPTPPNSISPALPPHGLKAQLQKAASKLEPIDSDLDLQDAVDQNGAFRGSGQRRPSALSGVSGMSGLSDDAPAPGRAGIAALANAAALSAGMGSPPYESADSITPAMLAKYHLPEILLNHGPLAIRFIIGHLTASVPGFSFIPPAKSRRLVVAALEGRGNGVEGGLGGLEGDVEFQKVSWGIWSARRIGNNARSQAPLSSIAPNGLLGIPIAAEVGKGNMAVRPRQPNKGTNGAAGGFHHDDEDEEMYMMENEADKMSMDDDDGAASCSTAPDDDDMDMDDDPDNMTDDEDWGAVGAAALRAASYSNSATAGRYSGHSFLTSRPYASVSNYPATGARSRQSFSLVRPPSHKPTQPVVGFTPFRAASDEQEREAVEALMRLGSV